MVRILIKLSQRVDWTAEIGSKKLIKSQLEYDLQRNLTQGQTNLIGLEF